MTTPNDPGSTTPAAGAYQIFDAAGRDSAITTARASTSTARVIFMHPPG